MRFTCYKNDLVEALQVAIRSVAVKPITQILSGIYLRVDGRDLEMQANNFSTGIVIRVPVNVESEGEVVLSGKKFQEFVRNMPDETITLFGEEAATTFSMESGGAQIELLTMPASEFPKVKVPDTYGSFTIRSNVLKNLIRKTIFAVAKDDDRPVFRGCCFEIDGNKISLVATNAQRIAIAKESLQHNDTNDNVSFVVPSETLRYFNFDPNDVENTVEVKYSDRIVTFGYNNVYITSRLLEGGFPDYERVFQDEYTTHVKINKAELRNAVDLIALTARESEFNMIKFDIMQGRMEISAYSPDIGEARKNIEVETSGDMLEIAFNVDYLLDALRVMDTPFVHMHLNGNNSPVLLSEPDNENYSYIITPVRI